MLRSFRFVLFAAFGALIAFHTCHAFAQALPASSSASSPAKNKKLPRPQPLGHDTALERDAITGELHSLVPAGDAGGNGAIRSHVTLVQVACTVTAPDGTQVRGLARDNFRIFEDGAAQEIASFDASAAPASIALVLDVSPSIFRELAEMRDAAHSLAANLSPADEIAVVSFSSEAHLVLPFSTDRESNIYESVFLTARELFRGRTGRKAIVLLTDGQDSGLGLTWDPASAQPREGAAASRLAFDDVARELGGDGIALFIVSTENRPRAMTPAWLEAHGNEMLVNKNSRREQMPHYTLYLAELGRRVGGQLYFLREIGNLSEIYRRIALTISAQYTLGYYPTSGTARPGWRSLRVELSPDSNVPPRSKLAHRSSYYVSAFP